MSTNTTPGPLPRHFVPTPQYELPQYACPRLGHRYNSTFLPEGRERTTPMACKKCDKCLGYRKHVKYQQWQASVTSPTATFLKAEFPTPDAAAYFAGLKGLLSRRERFTKLTILKQTREAGPDHPCWVRIIWDCVATNRQITNVRKRAFAAGGRRRKCGRIAVSEAQFLEWLPDQPTLMGEKTSKRKTGKINACRFPNGCAQPLEIPDDWRDGLSRNSAIRSSSERRLEPTNIERGVKIRNSWRPFYIADPDSPIANRRLERARYVNAYDWIHRWMTMDEETPNLSMSREFINAYLSGQNPDVKQWQLTTRGPRPMVVETARWLNGERDPEPATILVAHAVELVKTPIEKHIDPNFLNELDQTLPHFYVD